MNKQIFLCRGVVLYLMLEALFSIYMSIYTHAYIELLLASVVLFLCYKMWLLRNWARICTLCLLFYRLLFVPLWIIAMIMSVKAGTYIFTLKNEAYFIFCAILPIVCFYLLCIRQIKSLFR